jgi:prepilin-type processing-associated H-X9-DG protein
MRDVDGKLCITGIVWLRSRFTLTDVKDGLSHTYLIGEKYVDLDAARTGKSYGDNWGPFISDDRNIVRWGVFRPNATTSYYLPPQHDTRGNPNNPNDPAYGLYGLGTLNFGSAHATGFNMALCDGSVKFITYEISETIHRHYCNRTDGIPDELPE